MHSLYLYQKNVEESDSLSLCLKQGLNYQPEKFSESNEYYTFFK